MSTHADLTARAVALLEAWLGGQGAGSAIADMLLGDLAPEGRLAESLPAELAQVPAQLNFPGEAGVVEYGERIFVGYRGLDARGTAGGDILGSIRVRVTNLGERAGAEIVRLYVGRESPSGVARAPRSLAGFAKLRLEAGESREIDLPITRRALSHWDAAAYGWAVEEGRWILADAARPTLPVPRDADHRGPVRSDARRTPRSRGLSPRSAPPPPGSSQRRGLMCEHAGAKEERWNQHTSTGGRDAPVRAARTSARGSSSKR